MAEPYHNLVDYYAENSNRRLTIDPVTVVGPYRYNGYFDDPNDGSLARKRWSIQAADPDVNFAWYDSVGNGGNGNGVIDQNELMVITVASQYAGMYHSFVVRRKSDFDLDSLERFTLTDEASGRNFDVLRGNLAKTQEPAHLPISILRTSRRTFKGLLARQSGKGTRVSAAPCSSNHGRRLRKQGRSNLHHFPQPRT